MLQLEENKTYTLYATEIVNGSGDDFILACDADHNLYRIKKVMNWQYEELPQEIRCVAKADKNGNLLLVQDLAYYYRKIYTVGATYRFTVKDVFVGYQNPHYVIEDEMDRFSYPIEGEPHYQFPETILLTVTAIDNDGQIHFQAPESENVQVSRASSPLPQKNEKQKYSPQGDPGWDFPDDDGFHYRQNDADRLETGFTTFSMITSRPLRAISLTNYAPANVLDLPDEGQHLELKSSIVFTRNGEMDVERQSRHIVQILASFMNVNDGDLYIGVDDNKRVIGIENDFKYLNSNPNSKHNDYKQTPDGYENLIRNRMEDLCQSEALELVQFEFPTLGGKTYCHIHVSKASRPIWENRKNLWVRSGNSSRQKWSDDITFFIKKFKLLKTGTEYYGFSRGIPNPGSVKSGARNEIVQAHNVANTVATVQPSNSDIAYYITWYKNCTYQKTSAEKTDENVLASLPVYKSMEDGGVVLFCYKNGYVNKVRIKELMDGMTMDGSSKGNAYSQNAELLEIRIALPTDILAVISSGDTETRHVKAHNIEDVNPTSDGGDQGSIFVPSPCTDLQYKLVSESDRRMIDGLILPKDKLNNENGFPVSNRFYKKQIEFLLQM